MNKFYSYNNLLVNIKTSKVIEKFYGFFNPTLQTPTVVTCYLFKT
jgi:hypothetical protein